MVSHKSGRGPKTPHNYRYRLRLRGYGPESGLEYRADEIPQCQEMIAAYRFRCGLETATPGKNSSRNLVEHDNPKSSSETRTRKRKTTCSNSHEHPSRSTVEQSDSRSARKTKKRRRTLPMNLRITLRHEVIVTTRRSSKRKRTRAWKLND